jgi:hypothetical protein
VSTDSSNSKSDPEISHPMGSFSDLDDFIAPERFVVSGWCCPNSFDLNRKSQFSVLRGEELSSDGILIDPG